ncbi:MAG: mannose-1-phosphate guanylyltransferase/mannose-6-phosphate isomerase [Sphingomonas sp.]
MSSIRPVIMCGGSGTRLWPFSRQELPKQLLPIVSDQSLLQETALRVSSAAFAAPVIVAGEEHRDLIEEQLREIGIEPQAILLEPEPRNTAAVTALACEWALSNGDDLVLLMPSDHVIMDKAALINSVDLAVPRASDGGIVTFGIRPGEPNTQYGYIEASPLDGANHVQRIERFVEKPDAGSAAIFCQSGRHYWNSGIFLFRATAMAEELREHLPATHNAIARAFEERVVEGRFVRPNAECFSALESISLDYAVMQKTRRGFVVPVDMGWSDVGTWSSVWSSSPKDKDNNVVAGDVLTLGTRNSLIRSYGSATIVTIGLEDLVVVGTKDAVLVAPMSRSDEVRNIVAKLAAAGRSCATTAPEKALEIPMQVQPGPYYLEEDDIARVEDGYGIA